MSSGLYEFCANCDEEFELTSQQKYRRKHSPNVPLYCCAACRYEWMRENGFNPRATPAPPWHWLGCKKILHELPELVTNEVIY